MAGLEWVQLRDGMKPEEAKEGKEGEDPQKRPLEGQDLGQEKHFTKESNF